MPFRDAYKCTGTMVAACIREGKTLEELTLDEFKQCSDLFAGGCVYRHRPDHLLRGPYQLRRAEHKASVLKQVALVKAKLE